MKVLRQGRLAEDEVYEGECIHCGTLVQFQRKEARFVDDQRDGAALVVICPTCNNEIWTAVKARGER